MCGIVGIASSIEIPQSYKDNFANALAKLEHRGPDSFGVVEPNDNVILGHKRLSIVELSELGSQPMTDETKRYIIIFNGEVYNHNDLREQLKLENVNFTSASDTEVVLKAYIHWGEQSVTRFNGVFAFSIFDTVKNTMFLARDRSGEKPLYFCKNTHDLIFSSELESLTKLISIPLSFNSEALISYLANGYSTGSASLIEGVNVFEPGHIGKYDLNTNEFHTKAYWTVPSLKSDISDKAELVEKLKYLLTDSIGLQLQCDVPACVLLSGGVDSSVLTALAAEQSKKIKTFTVRFPGHPKFDETESARLIANHFSTEHTEIEGVDLSPDLFMEVANKIDVPINDSSLLPTYLVNQAVSKHCKVALGGDGGDELFGGYKHYSRMINLNERYKSLIGVGRFFNLQQLKNLVPEHIRARNWFECFGHDLDSSIPNIREIFDSKAVSKLLSTNIDESTFNDVWHSKALNHGSLLRNCTIADFTTYLRDSILIKSDRCSMLNSVEARAPLLDYRIIDFAFSDVPDCFKTRANQRKILLKDLARQVLPDSFDFDRKLGFNLPLGEMMRKGKWKDMFGDILHSDSNTISLKYRQAIFNKHIDGHEFTDKIFGLALLLIWSKRVGVS